MATAEQELERIRDKYGLREVATLDFYDRPLSYPHCGSVLDTWERRERHINYDHPTAGRNA
jgi:hypothetical protein